MNIRLSAAGAAVLCAAVFAACGGGGGGNPPVTTPAPTATATPTQSPTPTPTPTLNPDACLVTPAPFVARKPSSTVYPISANDCFVYQGSSTTTIAISQPSPQPSSVAAANVQVEVSPSPTSMPNGGGAGSAVISTEEDAYPTETLRTTTDSYEQVAANGDLLLYKTVQTDASNDSVSTTYATPHILDQSAASWTNSPAATIAESVSDGTQISRTVASDGSYTDNETYAGSGGNATIQVNGEANGTSLNGSGTYTINSNLFGDTVIQMGAPSGGFISITLDPGTSNAQTLQAQQWFAPSSSLITDNVVNNGQQSFSSSCGSLPGAVTSARNHQLVETLTTTDPVLGYIDTRTTTSWIVSGVGTACVLITDTLKSFYDYQDNTPAGIYVTNSTQPVSTNSFSEALSIVDGGPYASVRRPASATSSSSQTTVPLSPLTVAQHIAAIDLRRAVDRAEKIRALHTFLLRKAAKGIAQ